MFSVPFVGPLQTLRVSKDAVLSVEEGYTIVTEENIERQIAIKIIVEVSFITGSLYLRLI